MSVQTKVLEIIATVIKQPLNALNADSGLSVTDNWDSLNHTLIVLELEEAFDIGFDFDELEKIITVSAIVKSLESKGVTA
ncbi:acyl carrier protein [Pseudomonas sp. OIL-1]|uniref:acyl carrier protein n=1 Tax=Pseudomonas sp. OIL-1 TaxID=2706126 RepID=UPI0013A7B4E1|nr:acyl carrier protein [Pseudomonas sp. OIL-1]QIB52615.1 acyl carrier protein [Pseudomonas sp. OIL-1]